MANQGKKIVAVLHDLMFQVKIEQAAKGVGFEPVFVQSQPEALARAQENPAVIILDLNDRGIEPIETIAKLKGDLETSRIKLLGFVSHIQADLQKAARDQGCDLVIARSAFSQKLPAILEQFK